MRERELGGYIHPRYKDESGVLEERRKQKEESQKQKLPKKPIGYAKVSDWATLVEEYAVNMRGASFSSYTPWNAFACSYAGSSAVFPANELEGLLPYLERYGDNKVPVYVLEETKRTGEELALLKVNDGVVVARADLLVFEEAEATQSMELVELAKNEVALTDQIASVDQTLENIENFHHAELDEQFRAIEEAKKELEQRMSDLKALQAKYIEEQMARKKELEWQLFVLDGNIYSLRSYTGDVVEFRQIRAGKKAPIETPLVIQQKTVFLDEDLPRFIDLYADKNKGLYGFEDILQMEDAINHLAHSDKAVFFVKMSRNNNEYRVYSDSSYERVLSSRPNQTGIVIRNGENIWLAWTDSDRISIGENAFASRSTHEETTSKTLLASRIYIGQILQGLVDRKELLELPGDHNPLETSPYIVLSNADNQLETALYPPMWTVAEHLWELTADGDPVYLTRTLRGYRDSQTSTRTFSERDLLSGRTVSKGLHTASSIDYSPTQKYVSLKTDPEMYIDIRPNCVVYGSEGVNLRYLNSLLINHWIHPYYPQDWS